MSEGTNSEFRRDFRARMREDADKLYPDIIESLKVALDSEVTKWGDCPKCGKRVPVAFPDLHGRAKAIQLLIEQGYGKPTETIEVSATMEADLALARLLPAHDRRGAQRDARLPQARGSTRVLAAVTASPGGRRRANRSH